MDLFLLQLVRFSHMVGWEGETAVGYRFLEGKANMEKKKQNYIIIEPRTITEQKKEQKG